MIMRGKSISGFAREYGEVRSQWRKLVLDGPLSDVVEDAVAETSRELHEAEVKILGLAFAAEVKTTDGVVATLNDLAATRS